MQCGALQAERGEANKVDWLIQLKERKRLVEVEGYDPYTGSALIGGMWPRSRQASGPKMVRNVP